MLYQNKISQRVLFAAGCMMGAAVFLLLFTAAPLDVTNDSWLRTGFVEKDIIQHYTGWLFFRESGLSFPLGMADNMNYPYGSAVTFTDSIPLFAIFFRLIEGILPETFQYFGLFSLLAYMLQGGAAMLLCSLFTRKLPALCFGTLLLVCNPILIERTFRHTALSAHFLILFALYLYFKNKKEGFAFRKGYLVLLGIGIAIHPYFIPMLFGILFADLVEHCVHTKEYRSSALFLAAGFAVVLGIGYCIGIFSVPASGETLVGYGYFSMNLNSLWTPVSAGGLLWSSILPAQNQGLGTYEGFNYLGLAVLFAAPVCLIVYIYQHKLSGIRAALKAHCGLCFVCICLTLFALSTTWVANIRVLFSIPLPDAIQSLCDIFRASGRMFWPVYYLIFLFVIVSIAKMRSARISCVVLALVLTVQVADLQGILCEKHAFFTEQTATFETPLTDALWDEIAENYDHLFSLDEYLYDATSVALYAATNGMTTNDGFMARFDVDTHNADIEAEIEKLTSGEFSEGTFYLTSDESTFVTVAAATQGLAYAVRIDWEWYAILPIVDGLEEPVAGDTLFVYPLIPFMLPEYSDDYFTDGVSNDDPSVVTFYLNEFTTLYIGSATAIIDEDGNSYEILEYSFEKAGRFIITLDIEDANILKGQYLTSSDNNARPPHAD